MKNDIRISEDLSRRIDTLAERSALTRDQIIEDALPHGHSLEWQEHFLEKVAKGVAAADRGEFASADEISRVRNKYRPS